MQVRTVKQAGSEIQVNMPDKVDMVVNALNEAQRGRFAFVRNHVSGIAGEGKCITPTISNVWFLAMPIYSNLLARQVERIAALTLTDVISNMAPDTYDELREKCESNVKKTSKGKDKKNEPDPLDMMELFVEAKQNVLASIRKTQTGDRSDAHRKAHDTFYVFAGKAKLHLQSEPDPNSKGRKRLVLGDNNKPIVDSVMVPWYEIRRDKMQAGQLKPTNSRPLTMMQNAIKSATGLPKWKEFSLGRNNYTAMSLDSKTIFGWVRDMNTAELDSALAHAYRTIGNLPDTPMRTLAQEAARTPVTASQAVSSTG